MKIYEASVSLMVRALVVSARWAARSRRLSLEQACARAEAGRVAQLEARVMVLEDAVAFRDARLEVLEKRLGEERPRRPYPLMERLHILWLIEYYQIPKRRVQDTFGVARSTVHRWLKGFQEGKLGGRRPAAEPVNKTPREIAELIWDIFARNPMWGRHRIAMTLWVLGVFVSATTVVVLIRGLGHLGQLLADFEEYYNECRCHQRLGGATPSMMYEGRNWQKPERSAKLVLGQIRLRHFREQRITVYELAA